MAFGNPTRKKTPLRAFVMLVALVLAAFSGAAIGLFFQNTEMFDDTIEEEVVTGDQPD
ncbi:hypothetical protein [Aurantiacibacter gangjinensis]|uniref:hypothetical protein n=1 Tax=Aurantiacibacter gangjinensis TaxID=502682 RepID=UPI00090C45DC|nr:hypothetical protein [Aurantiacibacter gangjinensis]APE29291.1 hypothetical protein BMF35_b0036 [Aurantiacibacter gangjinensis]